MQGMVQRKSTLWRMLILGSLLAAVAIVQCRRTKFSSVPAIEILGISRDTMVQGAFNQDSILVYLAIRDGDGDIGEGPDDTLPNIEITLINTGVVEYIRMPEIEHNASPIYAEATVRIYMTCCVYDDAIPPCTPTDSVQHLVYQIRIRDQRGQWSNSVQTTPIALLCR